MVLEKIIKFESIYVWDIKTGFSAAFYKYIIFNNSMHW
jgi:hypothetical protein